MNVRSFGLQTVSLGIGLNVLYCRLNAVGGDFGFSQSPKRCELVGQEGRNKPFGVYLHRKNGFTSINNVTYLDLL